MSDLNSDVIGIIKKIRIEKGLSQEKLSDLSGLDSKYINKLENGRFNLTLPTLERILGGLEINKSTFFSYIDTENSSSLNKLINTINEFEYEKREDVLLKIKELISIFL